MKKRELVIFSAVMILLLVSLASASIFSDLWGKITGKATSGTASVNITLGNTAPTVPFVSAIAAQDPTIGGTTNITFNYTASDIDGMSNINNATAAAYFNMTGETTRSNASCIPRNASGTSITFTCTISMWYFDKNGAWTINATIQDINSAYGENSTTTFTYNSLTAMVMAPTSLTWPAIGVAATNTGSNNDPITVNNSGNAPSLSINVTALNLRGETTTTQFIYAANFTVDNITEGCSGTAMANATSTNVTNANLGRGNNSLNYNNQTSGQEQIFFCLKGVLPSLSSQSYSSAAYGPWTVAVQ